jgi:hypothetical protein
LDDEIADKEIVQVSLPKHCNRLSRGIYNRLSPEIERGVEYTIDAGRFAELSDERVIQRVRRLRDGLRAGSPIDVYSSGKVSTTDGPYAETKEQIGGFYIVDANDIDAALDWASKVTLAINTPIEVRPFMDVPPR